MYTIGLKKMVVLCEVLLICICIPTHVNICKHVHACDYNKLDSECSVTWCKFVRLHFIHERMFLLAFMLSIAFFKISLVIPFPYKQKGSITMKSIVLLCVFLFVASSGIYIYISSSCPSSYFVLIVVHL